MRCIRWAVVHSLLPPTWEETTPSMWANVNALKKEISLSEKERSKQRVESFLDELEGGIASFTDEEFVRPKRLMERRGHTAAYAIVAPIGTTQPSNPDRAVHKYRSMYVVVEDMTLQLVKLYVAVVNIEIQ